MSLGLLVNTTRLNGKNQESTKHVVTMKLLTKWVQTNAVKILIATDSEPAQQLDGAKVKATAMSNFIDALIKYLIFIKFHISMNNSYNL